MRRLALLAGLAGATAMVAVSPAVASADPGNAPAAPQAAVAPHAAAAPQAIHTAAGPNGPSWPSGPTWQNAPSRPTVVTGFECAVDVPFAVPLGIASIFLTTNTFDVTATLFGSTGELMVCKGTAPAGDFNLTKTTLHTTACSTLDGNSANFAQVVASPNGAYVLTCAYSNGPIASALLNALNTIVSSLTGGELTIT